MVQLDVYLCVLRTTVVFWKFCLRGRRRPPQLGPLPLTLRQGRIPWLFQRRRQGEVNLASRHQVLHRSRLTLIVPRIIAKGPPFLATNVVLCKSETSAPGQ